MRLRDCNSWLSAEPSIEHAVKELRADGNIFNHPHSVIVDF